MSWLCEKCANTNCRRDTKPGEIVVKCGAFKRPMTNADRIRAMSDEEMAEFLSAKLSCVLCDWPDLMLKWLQQSPKEE